MPRVDLTLYGDDGAQFDEMRERFGEVHRNGNTPSRAEFARILMGDFDRLDIDTGSPARR
jgi:hypothetical protein